MFGLGELCPAPLGALLGGNLELMKGVSPQPPQQQLGGPWGFGEQRAILQQQLGRQQATVNQQLGLSAEPMRRFKEAADGDVVSMQLLPVPPRRESKAVRCFLRNLRRLKRALEKDEGWTISEARVPLWLAEEIRKHPKWLPRTSDRAFCEGREELQVGDEVCRFRRVPIVVGGDRIEFSYKKVA